MSRILVTGGCGYVGSVLVPKLLAAGHTVDVYDIQWFGNSLPPSVKVFKADIRKMVAFTARFDAIIHLAGIANDPTGELDPKLTWEVNALATAQLADMAMRAGVKQFIYASSGSVYGVKQEAQVTEDLPLVPISEYNKTKMVAERVLLSYADKMAVQILRPGTVCGYSPRMRLDVAVNGLTMQALTKSQITVLGGEQSRPNIHIADMTDLYVFMLEHPALTGVYNAGFENYTINEIAAKIKDAVRACKITVKPSNDPRSYRMNSEKILKAGFAPKFTVRDAIGEIRRKFEAGKLKDEDRHYNIRSMQK